MEEKTKRIIKITLVVLLLGPLIFMGVCTPLAGFGWSLGTGAFGLSILGLMVIIGAFIIAGALAISTCYYFIQKIRKKEMTQRYQAIQSWINIIFAGLAVFFISSIITTFLIVLIFGRILGLIKLTDNYSIYYTLRQISAYIIAAIITYIVYKTILKKYLLN